jgi:hypothetical protein
MPGWILYSESDHFAAISDNMGRLINALECFLHALANSERMIQDLSDGLAGTQGTHNQIIFETEQRSRMAEFDMAMGGDSVKASGQLS